MPTEGIMSEEDIYDAAVMRALEVATTDEQRAQLARLIESTRV